MNRPNVLGIPPEQSMWEPLLERAYDLLVGGDLVVLPTDTVYGVACDPFSLVAVARLFEAKQRGRDLPLPVFVQGWRQAVGLVEDLDERARRLMTTWWPGPLTVVLRQARGVGWDLGDADGSVALRTPNQPFTQALLRRTGPLAVTSANRSGQPTPTTIEGVAEQLGERVAAYFDAGPSSGGPASTILDLTGGEPRLLRAGAVARDELERELGMPLAGAAESA